MSSKTHFKAFVVPAVRVGAADTKTFPTREEAQQSASEHASQGETEIIEVDSAGRPVAPREIPIASAGTIAGIEQYACTHCLYTSPTPNTSHECQEYGRDDSTTTYNMASTDGTLSATAVSRGQLPPAKYFVVWQGDDRTDRWQAVLMRQELVQLLATNHWGAEMLGSAAFGIPGFTFSADGQVLAKFGFRHVAA